MALALVLQLPPHAERAGRLQGARLVGGAGGLRHRDAHVAHALADYLPDRPQEGVPEVTGAETETSSG